MSNYHSRVTLHTHRDHRDEGVRVSELLRGLSIGVTYRSGRQAWTDLHAGGLFFCIVYRECLRFGRHGLVWKWFEVIDDSWPLDDDQAKEFQRDRSKGKYRLTDRGYLEVVFPDLNLTGRPCEQARDLLAFHGFRPSTGTSFSLVYRRSKKSGRHAER